MHNLHENQKKILDYLLDKPDGVSADDLIEVLGVTKTAVKEHLLKVERLGLISYKDIAIAVGRPKRFYFLTPEGQEAFPRQYSWLSIVLLEHLSEERGGESVSHFMKGLAEKVVSSMSERFKKSTPKMLLMEVTSVLCELGYRAILKQSDLRKGAIIEATNCVYHSVAKKHPELCQFDIQFISKATGMNVKLESCIARGGQVCRFCINNKDQS